MRKDSNVGDFGPSEQELGVQYLRVGIGSDHSFRLDVTEEQWTRYDLRGQLARYARFLTSALQDATLQPGEDASGAFTFTLGRGATLKFPRAERLDVRVDGRPICGFDRAPVSAAVIRPLRDPDAPGAGSQGTRVLPIPQVQGVITFDDVERIEPHVAHVTDDADNFVGGTVSAMIQPAGHHEAGTPGALVWRYSLADPAAAWPPAGMTFTEAYMLTDPRRVALQFRLVVDVTGTTGAPVCRARVEETAGPQDGGVRHSGSGSVSLEALATRQSFGARVSAGVGNPLGGRLAVLPQAAGGGTLWWSYTVSHRALSRLGDGEALKEHFVVCLGADEDGNPLRRRLTIAVSGSDAAPVIELVAIEAEEGPRVTGCGLAANAAAVVELTRSLWLSRPGIMLVSSRREVSAKPTSRRGVTADRLGVERLRRVQ